MSTRICVDLNGVLDTYTGWQGTVTWHAPREGARSFLTELRARGHEVVIMTTRDPRETLEWLTRHGMDHLVAEVTNHKVSALAYVDDRAVRFDGDFEETLAALDRFRTFWERDGTEGEPIPDGRPPNEPGEGSDGPVNPPDDRTSGCPE